MLPRVKKKSQKTIDKKEKKIQFLPLPIDRSIERGIVHRGGWSIGGRGGLIGEGVSRSGWLLGRGQSIGLVDRREGVSRSGGWSIGRVGGRLGGRGRGCGWLIVISQQPPWSRLEIRPTATVDGHPQPPLIVR